jgi:hypothetical protein
MKSIIPTRFPFCELVFSHFKIDLNSISFFCKGRREEKRRQERGGEKRGEDRREERILVKKRELCNSIFSLVLLWIQNTLSLFETKKSSVKGEWSSHTPAYSSS